MNEIDWNRTEEILGLENSSLKQDKIELLIKQVESKYNCDDKEYMLGYIWYYRDLKVEDRKANILKYFNLSILKKVELDFSYLYLMYFFFDEKDYEKSMGFYKKINFDFFSSTMNQKWREVNCLDIYIACKVSLKETEGLKDIIDSLSKKWKELDNLYKPTIRYTIEALLKHSRDSFLSQKISLKDILKLEKMVLYDNIMTKEYREIYSIFSRIL